MEEVSTPVKSYGMGVCSHLDIGGVLPDGGSGGVFLRIRYLDCFSMHWEDAGRFSPSGGMINDWVADETEGGQELVLPPTRDGNERSFIGGSGDIRRPPTEYCRMVHYSHNHNESTSCGGSAP